MSSNGYIILSIVLLGLVSNCANGEERERLIALWKDEQVKEMIEKVSRDNLIETIRKLQNYKTRYTHAKQREVSEFVHDSLKERKLDVRYHNYFWKGELYKNVEVRMKGSRDPGRFLVLGAHYDSKSEIPEEYAPGADDNGSGVAALLEVARILKDYEMRNTVRIVFFSNEERGQRGSSAYVKYIKSLPEGFSGAIIVDMLGYGPEEEDLDVATLSKFKWLALATKEIGEMYDLIPMKLRVDKHCY